MYKTTSILILTAIAAMILSIFGLRGETDIAIVNYFFEILSNSLTVKGESAAEIFPRGEVGFHLHAQPALQKFNGDKV